jgi:hypothetical protein
MWLGGFKMAEVGTVAIVHHVKWLSLRAPHLSVNASMPNGMEHGICSPHASNLERDGLDPSIG